MVKARPVGFLFLLGLFAALVAACGTDDPTPAPGPVDPTEPVATATPTTTDPTAPDPDEPAFDAEAYFSGQRINIIVGFAPGGGYDTASRLLARWAREFFPGNPNFVVTNMPGAGSLRALQHTMRSEADGFTIHPIHSSFPHAAIRGDTIEHFDMDRTEVVGGVSCGDTPSALYVQRSIAQTWDEVRGLGRDITNGMTQTDESSGTGPRFAQLLGEPVRNIAGYGGTSEIMAAFDRGELDSTTRGGYDNVPRLFPEWITNKYHMPVFRWGPEPESDPDFVAWMETLEAPMPPHLFEVTSPTQEQEIIFETVRGINSMWGHAFVLPPGTPPEVVQVWRDVLQQTTASPQYLEAALALGYQAEYCTPEALLDVYNSGKETLEQNPELTDFLNRLMGEGF